MKLKEFQICKLYIIVFLFIVFSYFINKKKVATPHNPKKEVPMSLSFFESTKSPVSHTWFFFIFFWRKDLKRGLRTILF